jgi:hypothetical protein
MAKRMGEFLVAKVPYGLIIEDVSINNKIISPPFPSYGTVL